MENTSIGTSSGSHIGGDVNVIGDFVGRDKIVQLLATSQLSEQEQRLRNIMLDKVYNFWVKGVLEKSFYDFALIDLEMEYQPDAVNYPWEMVVQRPDLDSRLLPHGTKIIDVFDEQGGELLILGSPGSGKTTMLLDLAHRLIIRARKDASVAIPVVFALSTWVKKRLSIDEWLVEELHIRYKVSEKTAKEWIDRDKLSLLLDGVDEVPELHRDKCIEAINDFRNQHDLICMVICSRLDDYNTLNSKLDLQGAVLLQPLNMQQITHYLVNGGEKLLPLLTLVKQNQKFQQLAQTPLLLNIMALVYRNSGTYNLSINPEIENVQSNLMASYVDRMFQRRGSQDEYLPQDTVRWLTWLAHKLDRHSQTIFHIEQLQPEWLETQSQQQIYNYTLNLLIKLTSGIMWGLVGGMLLGRTWGIGLAIVAILIYRYKPDAKNVTPIEVIRWSWQKTRQKFWPIMTGNLFWGVFAVIVIAIAKEGGSLLRFFSTLLLTFVINFPEAIFAGFEGEQVSSRTFPNQGIQLSLRSALIGAAIRSLGNGIFVIATFQLLGLNPSQNWLIFVVVFVLLPALRGWLDYGGSECFKHFALRIILWRNNLIPWNYAHFLDYAAERILLRKVGGGYIFMHDLSREYFVSMGNESTEIIEEGITIPWYLYLITSLIAGIIIYMSGVFQSLYFFVQEGHTALQSPTVYVSPLELPVPTSTPNLYGTAVLEVKTPKIEAITELREKLQSNYSIQEFAEFVDFYDQKLMLDFDERVVSEIWNDICRYGALNGHVTKVLPVVCEKAIELADEYHLPVHRDSRGIARAMAGDFSGAIEDFTSYFERYKDTQYYEPYGRLRHEWIEKLRRNKNPFDEKTLQILRQQ